jgi:hypothetical protein
MVGKDSGAQRDEVTQPELMKHSTALGNLSRSIGAARDRRTRARGRAQLAGFGRQARDSEPRLPVPVALTLLLDKCGPLLLLPPAAMCFGRAAEFKCLTVEAGS